MSFISIQTAQNIDVEYELAGLGHRIVACMVDMLLFIAYFLVAFYVLRFAGIDERISETAFIVIVILPVFLYYLLTETLMNGQSIGKKLMHIKVISLDGGQPSLRQYLLRWIFRLIDVTFSQGVIAVIAVAISHKGQRLGDMVANTTVVNTRPTGRLEQTLFVPVANDYVISYPEVANLSAQDMLLIKEVLQMQHREEGYYLAAEAARKIENVLNIHRKEEPAQFLYILLQDYNHLP